MKFRNSVDVAAMGFGVVVGIIWLVLFITAMGRLW